MVDDGVFIGPKGHGRYCPAETGSINDISNAKKEIR